MPSFTLHSGIADLMDQYDGFILDQFGVMHNGTTHLPGADEAVAALHRAGKKLVILSNSSSLAGKTVAKLPKLGFQPEHFVTAVTSGQEAVHYLRKTHQHKKALLFTWKAPKVTPSPTAFIAACNDITVTGDVAEAEVILLHGPEVLRGPGPDGEASELSLGDYHAKGVLSVINPILEKCLERNLPMVCVNPDYIMVKPDNTQVHMPGTIADTYKNMGGNVAAFGKPHREHFEACVRQLQLPKAKVVHVGDSLHHDIEGANNTGIASIFVAGGVHRDELGGCELGTLPSEEALEALFTKHKQSPTHVVPLFRM